MSEDITIKRTAYTRLISEEIVFKEKEEALDQKVKELEVKLRKIENREKQIISQEARLEHEKSLLEKQKKFQQKRDYHVKYVIHKKMKEFTSEMMKLNFDNEVVGEIQNEN